MKKTIIGFCAFFSLLVTWNHAAAQSSNIIPLQGIWKFKLDPFFTGISSNGVQMMPQLPEAFTLPGSTDQAGKGIKTQDMTSLRLTRLFEYKGAAWYEKEIFIPAQWKNKEIHLLLERAHWETSVWVNGQPAGKQQSLSTPHVYDLSSLLHAGEKNTLRIRVDNNLIYNIEYSHAVSAETQTNWNGIIGKMELQAFDNIHFEDIQVYPQPAQKTARFQITILNRSKQPLKGTVHFSGGAINTNETRSIADHPVSFSGSDSLLTVSTDLPLGEHVQLWDEFDPALYKIAVSLDAEQNGTTNKDIRPVVFGMRTLSTAGTRFTINGRPFFFRGTVNSAEFPLTGYPHMEVAQWEHIFNTCKAYGLNGMRFHSWCPPEAAFVAADKLGMYLFRESLRAHQLIDLAEPFTLASGKFQVIMKKEEIESYLRTPGMGGYHLLQLNDFPGQGTAPVGVVNIFWDPKPYVTAKEFSRFQSAGVPLLRTASFTFTNDQTFSAAIQFANFSKEAIPNATIQWSLQYENGEVYQQGSFRKTIPLGSPIQLGDVAIDLHKIKTASRLILSLKVVNKDYSNQWSIWVYPKTLPAVSMKNILVATDWNEQVKTYVRQGGKVLLLADTNNIRAGADPVFSGISWNTVWSGMPPNLLGILCDPAHPALKYFPTECHSNWQWWDVVRHSKPVVLDHTPAAFRPLIQMIPDWNNNKKTGLVWEAKVGKGSVLFSAVDLRNDLAQRPVARQLLYSLEEYISSEKFAPAEELTEEMIDAMFK